MRYAITFLALVGLAFFACKDKTLTPAEQLKADIQAIEKYLNNKGLVAQSTASGLHYIITQEGTGDHPTLQSKVTVKYKGYLLDGTVFDETKGSDTQTFSVNGVIVGWQEGIPLLRKGGKGTFYIPSQLAYGPDGAGTIPPNAPLIFEVELLSF